MAEGRIEMGLVGADGRRWLSRILALLLAVGVSMSPLGPVPAGRPGAPALAAEVGPTSVTGNITTDQTWTPAGSPYVLSGTSVYVRNGATLTIEPGTVVKVAPTGGTVNTGGLRVVEGRLVARGTEADPIVFTSLYDDSVGGDTDGGSGTPAPGDWAMISIDSPDEVTASETSPSVITNAFIRYGGAGGAAGCPYGAAVSVGSLGRLRLSKSEIVYAYGVGVSSGALVPGVGSLSVSNVGVRDSGCGFFPRAGTFTNNVVDQSVPRSFWSNYPTGVVMSGNWFANLGTALGDAPDRDVFDFRNNAVPGGFVSSPRSQVPVDLSYNWWGPNPTMPGSCHVNGDTEVPAVSLVVWTADSGCPWPNPVHGEHFTKVLPFSAMPPVPQTGPGADPSAPAPVPWEQMLGGVGASEYTYPARGSMADPVSTATGAYTEERVDAALPTPGFALLASRTYNSVDPVPGWLGKGWHFGYEAWLEVSADNSVVVLHAEDGQQVRFDRQADGSYSGGPGATARLERDGDGWTVLTRAQVTRSFDADGRLRSIVDRNGNTIALTYDTQGLLQQVGSAGRSLTLAHNPAGLITRVTLNDGRFVAYGYTDSQLTSVRDLAGRVTSYAYDTEGRLTSVTDAAGVRVMRLAYDPSSGRVTDQWDALGNHTQFGWDAATGVATMTDPRGGVWTDHYEGNLLMRRTTADGASTSYTYDAKLQLISTDGPRGVFQEFTYNDAGDLVAVEGPNGLVRTSFDNRHRPVTSINARGTQVDYSYDSAGNLTRIQRPEPGNPNGTLDTVFAYTGRGLLQSVTDARGETSTHTYTAAGDLASTTSPSGRTTTFSYDNAGRLTSSVDPRGNEPGAAAANFTTTYTYTDDDQPLTVTDPLGRQVRYAYDGVGRLQKTFDAKGRATTYTYDDAGHVTSVQGPDATIPATQYEYDANGNTSAVTDTAGRRVAYTYDAMNRPIRTTTPLGSTTYAYDRAGNLTKITDPTSQVTQMAYDAANRLIKIDYPSGTPDVTYRYDVNGNRTSMSDGAGTVNYTYDKLDRLKSATRGSSTFSYAYDRVGSPTTVTYPDGTAYSYSYDQDHRLDTVSRGPLTLADYGYDAASNPISLVRGNGTSADYTYDRAGQLTRVRDVRPGDPNPLVDETYSYDVVGNLTQLTTPNKVTTFAYDDLDRLTAACYATSRCDKATDYVRWSYDSADNRTREVRPAASTRGRPAGELSTDYTYDPATGLLTSSTGPSGTTTYNHDALGQMTKKTAPGGLVSTFAYNAAGRMTSATEAGTTTTYTYDGDGRRLTSATGGMTSNFLWEPVTHQLAAETDASNVVQRRYPYGLGALGLERPDQDSPTQGPVDYFHLDRIGSVRAVTNDAALPQWSYEWEPYGVPRSSSKLDAAARINPMGWLGQYVEPAPGASAQAGGPGLVHMRARQYDPALGRFTTPDPASAVSYSATGSYAHANPLAYTDPYGLWPDWNAVWNGATTVAPTVATVAGVAAPFTGPAAPFVGGIALAAGAITAADSAYDAYQVCTGAAKGSCAGEIATGALGIATGYAGGRAISVGLAARAAANTGTSALRGVDDVLGGLSKGKQSFVRTVPDEASLTRTFDDLTHGGTPTTWKNFSGTVIERGDGVQVGLRSYSKSGGSAIDIRMPDGKFYRIHVDQ